MKKVFHPKNQIEITAKIQQKEDALYELESAFFTSCVLDKKKKNWQIFFLRVDNFANQQSFLILPFLLGCFL